MGLALTYAQSITQILNFLIRVTAELEVNVSRLMLSEGTHVYCHFQLVAVERLTEYGELEPEADWRRGNRKAGTKWMDKVTNKPVTQHYSCGCGNCTINRNWVCQAFEEVALSCPTK